MYNNYERGSVLYRLAINFDTAAEAIENAASDVSSGTTEFSEAAEEALEELEQSINLINQRDETIKDLKELLAHKNTHTAFVDFLSHLQTLIEIQIDKLEGNQEDENENMGPNSA